MALPRASGFALTALVALATSLGARGDARAAPHRGVRLLAPAELLAELARPLVFRWSGDRIVTHPRQLLGDRCPDPVDEEAWGRVHAVTAAYLADRVGPAGALCLEVSWELLEFAVLRDMRECARDLLFYNRIGGRVAAANPGLWGLPRHEVLAKVEEMFRSPGVRAYERALAVICPP